MSVVTKLDRLGRSTGELLDLIDRISKAGASFWSLGDSVMGMYGSWKEAVVVNDAGRDRRVRARADPRAHLARDEVGHGCGIKFGRKRKLSTITGRSADIGCFHLCRRT